MNSLTAVPVPVNEGPEISLTHAPGWIRFNPVLAREIGIPEAIIFEYISQWIGSRGRIHNGRRWSYQTIRGLHSAFSETISIGSISKALRNLIALGLLLESRHENGEGRRIRHFALNEEILRAMPGIYIKSSGDEHSPIKITKNPKISLTAKDGARKMKRESPLEAWILYLTGVNPDWGEARIRSYAWVCVRNGDPIPDEGPKGRPKADPKLEAWISYLREAHSDWNEDRLRGYARVCIRNGDSPPSSRGISNDDYYNPAAAERRRRDLREAEERNREALAEFMREASAWIVRTGLRIRPSDIESRLIDRPGYLLSDGRAFDIEGRELRFIRGIEGGEPFAKWIPIEGEA